MAETAKWYVVHTYSGYENTVKATIEKTVESRSLQDQILAVSIPLETVTEITESGASKTYDRKVFPGYVLVKMVYSDDTWHVIRNVRGVTGFVGTSSNDPTPLTEEEVYAMGVEKKEIIVNYAVGDTVRILDGPLSSFTGTVESVDVDNNAVNEAFGGANGAWSCPCSAARPPSSLSLTRWRSFPSKRIGSISRSERGRGERAPQKMRPSAYYHILFRRCLLWHRKSLALSNCRSTPLRRPHPPLSAPLWVSTA